VDVCPCWGGVHSHSQHKGKYSRNPLRINGPRHYSGGFQLPVVYGEIFLSCSCGQFNGVVSSEYLVSTLWTDPHPRLPACPLHRGHCPHTTAPARCYGRTVVRLRRRGQFADLYPCHSDGISHPLLPFPYNNNKAGQPTTAANGPTTERKKLRQIASPRDLHAGQTRLNDSEP
jgi:hypothetical protein